jgi:ribonuclease HII
LAGPVVAAAVCVCHSKDFSDKKSKQIISLAKDSKQLSEKQREMIFELILGQKKLKWGIGAVNCKTIDKVNILNATKLAMKKAVLNIKGFKKNTVLIIDGNQKINMEIDQIAIVKGDQKIFLCSCASILAKVYRDRLMKRYDKKYPQYGFSQHKGYPTRKHYQMIKRYGLSPIHRKSFNCG